MRRSPDCRPRRWLWPRVCLLTAAAWSCVAAGRVGIDGQSPAGQPAPTTGREWLFVQAWPEHGGPGTVEHEELWIGAAREAKWRRLADRQVLALDEAGTVGADDVARLRALALSRPPLYRPLGDRQRAVDGRIGPYLMLVVGTGENFVRWGDEERFLESALTSLTRSILQGARPPRPSAPHGGSAWLQAQPLDPAIVDMLVRENRLLALSANDLTANPVVADAVAFPFLWRPLPGAKLTLAAGTVLGPTNPAAVVSVRGRALTLIFQQSATLP